MPTYQDESGWKEGHGCIGEGHFFAPVKQFEPASGLLSFWLRKWKSRRTADRFRTFVVPHMRPDLQATKKAYCRQDRNRTVWVL